MSAKNIKRSRDKAILKKRIKELLAELDLSKSAWKKMGKRVEGYGLDAKVVSWNSSKKIPWGRHKKGHKPGLKAQFSILWDAWREKIETMKLIEEMKKQAEEKESEKKDENQ